MSYPPNTVRPTSPAPPRPFQSPQRRRESLNSTSARISLDNQDLTTYPSHSLHSHSNSNSLISGAGGAVGNNEYRTSSADMYNINNNGGGEYDHPLNHHQHSSSLSQQQQQQQTSSLGHIRMISNASNSAIGETLPMLSNNNHHQQYQNQNQNYNNNNNNFIQTPPLNAAGSEMSYLDAPGSNNNNNNNNDIGVGYPTSNNSNGYSNQHQPQFSRGISDSYSQYSDNQSQQQSNMNQQNYSRGGSGGGGGGDSEMNLSMMGDNESQRGLYGTMSSSNHHHPQYHQQQQQQQQDLRGNSNLQYNNNNNNMMNESTDHLEKEDDPDRPSSLIMNNDKAPRRLTRSGMPISSSRNANPNKKKSSSSSWSSMTYAKKRCIIISGIIFILIIAAAAGAAGAVLAKNAANARSGATRTTSAKKGIPTGVTGADWTKAAYGGHGSLIYLADGSNFIYNNTFGGYWNSIPFNDTAQAQADVPALNQPWDYNVNLIQGVNLGGWLVIEPFIVPSLFEPFDSTGTTPAANASNPVVDEWTLSIALGTNMVSTITNHYETFITEKDFAEIAGAGLNWVRIPIPYWAIEVYPGEPFLANVAWTYFLKAIVWARKYGLRINLDLHAVPGSQNGYNHSSKLGTINFLNGVMGIANAQRTLNYIRTLTEFISQPQYVNVIPMFSVLNEPYAATIGVNVLRHFYMEAYSTVRGITGIGEGKGPMIVFHDGFVQAASPVSAGGWDGFMPGADRVAIDQHPYLCFAAPNNDGLSYQAAKPCAYWATNFNTSSEQFGLSMGGEWSLAINDCGKWVNNVGNGARFDGTYYQPGNTSAPQYPGVGSCDTWNNWESYSDATKLGLQQVAQGHQDALRHWFFWTWKTGYSTTLGKIANPLWNYQLALQNGFMPKDPRAGSGACTSLISLAGPPVTMVANPAPKLSAWMTGGEGAGTLLNLAQSSQFVAWPPSSIGSNATSAAFLPTYTPTQAIITQPVATPLSYPSGYASVTGPGNGWNPNSPNDSGGNFYTPVSGCPYPNPWSGAAAAIPTAVCPAVAPAAAQGAAAALGSAALVVPLTKRGGYQTHFYNAPGPTPAPTPSP